MEIKWHSTEINYETTETILRVENMLAENIKLA